MAIKDRAMTILRDEMAQARRLIAELEMALEVHDFQLISYEKYRKILDKKALRKIDEDGLNQVPSQEIEESSPEYTAKLIEDLEALQKKFVSAKLENADRVAQLQRERDKYREKVQSLEKCNSPAEIKGADTSNFECITSLPFSYFRQRTQVLESENIQQSRLVSTLGWQVENLTTTLGEKEEKFERVNGIYHRKNLALQKKIDSLKIELRLMSDDLETSGKCQHYEMLEAYLDDYISEISRLEQRLRNKERIISRLRTNDVEGKLQNPAPVIAAGQ